MSSTSKPPSYEGGFQQILDRMDGRRDPFSYAAGECLPPVDLDLAPLKSTKVGDPDADSAEAPPFRSSYHRKRHALRREFIDAPEICFLNGLLISHLRKRSWPDHALPCSNGFGPKKVRSCWTI